MADAQHPCCLFAIPAMGLQNLQNNFAFQFAGSLPGQRLQRDRPVQIDLGIEQILLPASNQVVVGHVFAAQDQLVSELIVSLSQRFHFEVSGVDWYRETPQHRGILSRPRLLDSGRHADLSGLILQRDAAPAARSVIIDQIKVEVALQYIDRAPLRCG